MSIINIRTKGDPVLGKVCKEITAITPKIKELIDDML